MRKTLIVILSILLACSTAYAGRNITLPFEEKFDSGDTWTSDLLWVGNGGTGTHVASEGCWSGGCAKFTPPTSAVSMNGGVNGMGQFTGISTTRLNVRLLVKVGTTYYSTATNAGGGVGNKFFIYLLDNASTRPMSIWQPNWIGEDVDYFSPGACNGTECLYQCGGTPDCYWPDGDDTFTWKNGVSGDYAGQWICMEFESDTSTGINTLYVWTQDGVLSGVYMQHSRTGGGNINTIDMIGGYYNHIHTNDANTYIMFDELKISNTYIGPPAGFVGGTPSRKLNNVTGVRVTLH